MKKIIVIGSPGAGKSCFSRELSLLTHIELFHMDNLYWHEDKSHISHEELVSKLNEIMTNETWIIDGNYISTMELRIKKADTIFYLDYPTEVCIEGIKARVGKKREDIPWVEDVLDSDFLKFVETFRNETKPKIESLLEKYDVKRVYRFCCREEMDGFLYGSLKIDLKCAKLSK